MGREIIAIAALAFGISLFLYVFYRAVKWKVWYDAHKIELDDKVEETKQRVKLEKKEKEVKKKIEDIKNGK